MVTTWQLIAGEDGPVVLADGFSFMVVGAGRGGTSLLACMLDRHPQLETRLEFATGILTEDPTAGLSSVDSRIAAFRAACQSEAVASQADRHWGNKVTTEQIAGLTLADGAFRLDGGVVASFYQQMDDIPSVFILRDGRTCVRSKMNRTELTMKEAAAAWRLSAKVYGWYQEGSVNGVAIRFEDLIMDPTSTLTEVCTFFDVPYNASMLEGTSSEKMRPEYRRPNVDQSVLSLDGIADGLTDLIAQELSDTGYT